MTSATLTA